MEEFLYISLITVIGYISGKQLWLVEYSTMLNISMCVCDHDISKHWCHMT